MTRIATPPRTARRRAALLAAALVAALLPVVAGWTSPAAAAVDCLDETYEYSAPPPFNLFPVGCDDTVAPDTVLNAVSPALSSQGFIRTTSITIAFGGSHTDADTGAIGFECQLYDTAVVPTTWTACTSPKTYSGLKDTLATAYTFRVRAVDADDADIDACDSSADLLNPGCAGEEPLTPDADDVDATPAPLGFRVDSTAPDTFLDRLPVDPIRPDRPVVLTTTPTLEVGSNEPATYACTLNGRSFKPCGPGSFTLRDVTAGDNTLVARAVDAAFNLDPTPATTTFFVPSDIRSSKGSGWTNVRRINQGFFDQDYVEARKVGQALVIKGIKKVREVRLVAPVGPRSGTIQVRVGSSQWYVVDLRSKTRRTAQFLVRDEFSSPQSGKIQIRVKSLRGKGSSVRLDALVAR